MAIGIQIVLGLLLSSLIGLLAYRRGSLSRGGVLGAMIVGTAIFGFGGLAWGLTLITFFVTSSLLSHYKESAKEHLAEKFDKGHQRDLGQALANGGAGAIIAIIFLLSIPTYYWTLPLYPFYIFVSQIPLQPPALLLAAFAGAMATVTADTWATELGVLSNKKTRLITTLHQVETGTSGGISLRGLLAALVGALVIGIVAVLFSNLTCATLLWIGDPDGVIEYGDPCITRPIFDGTAMILATTLAGLGGSLFDSLLGATVQAIYYCPSCRKDTERKVHTCGTPTTLKRGWRWLNNDGVNFVSSLIGAGIAVGFWLVLVQ
jgi:uncharacterized protein (TIGR00297 family)